MPTIRVLIHILTWPTRILLRTAFYYPKILTALIARAGGKTGGIIETVAGLKSFQNGNYACFVIRQPGDISWYVLNALEALARAEVNVLLVVNHELSSPARERLTPLCRQIIIRDNSGFDFGGFRDATLYAAENLQVDRMLYLNDSVYFFSRGLDAFMSRLATSPADVCSAFENWEVRYHLQSFALSVDKSIFYDQRFLDFWRNYLPANARRWAIHAGEMALSKVVVALASQIDVIYGPNDLRTALEALPEADLPLLVRYLPAPDRITEDARFRPRGKRLIEHLLMASIPRRSQVHTAGFLAHRFLDCPIIKRDLLYRLQFTVYDVEYCLRAAGTEEHLNDVLTDFRRRGRGNQLPWIKRLQFYDGII